MGYLVEVLSGLPLDVYLRERIFEPLGMVDTGFCVPSAKEPRLARLYAPDSEGGLEDVSGRLPASGLKMLSGGGGLFSTTRDYWRFAQMLCNGGELDGVQLLGRKTVDIIASNHIPTDMLPFVPSGWPYRLGYGMGPGGRVLLQPSAAEMPGSEGLFTWGGAASADFWVDRTEQLVGLCMLQYMPAMSRVIQDFRILAYQALADDACSAA